MKSLDIVSITNILLVLQKMELVLVVVFVPLRIVMKYSMRRETPNLRIEGIHSMNIITKLSGNKKRRRDGNGFISQNITTG